MKEMRTSREEIKKVVMGEIRRIMIPEREPEMEDYIHLDLGMDSIERVELTMALENIYEIEFNPVDMMILNRCNVRELVDMVEVKANKLK